MKKLSMVFIIVGIIIIAIPLIAQFYTEYKVNRMITEYYESEYHTSNEVNSDVVNPEEGYLQLQEAFNSERSSQLTDEYTNSHTAPSPVTSEATIPATSKTTPKQVKTQPKQIVLGIIKIDKIKVNTVIVEGAQPNNLRSGIGYLPGTSGIGKPGNCALAGHRSYTFGHFFNRLDELIEGDEIIISTKKSDYRYRVFEVLVVKPNDVSVLKGNKDDSIITLITCTPIFIATDRLIIHARLESQKEK